MCDCSHKLYFQYSILRQKYFLKYNWQPQKIPTVASIFPHPRPSWLAFCLLSSLTFVHCKCWHFTTHRHRGMILLQLHEWSPQIGMRKPENCRPASSFPRLFSSGSFHWHLAASFPLGKYIHPKDRWGPLLFLGAIVNDLPSEWVNDEQIYRGIVSNCFWFSAFG